MLGVRLSPGPAVTAGSPSPSSGGHLKNGTRRLTFTSSVPNPEQGRAFGANKRRLRSNDAGPLSSRVRRAYARRPDLRPHPRADDRRPCGAIASEARMAATLPAAFSEAAWQRVVAHKMAGIGDAEARHASGDAARVGPDGGGHKDAAPHRCKRRPRTKGGRHAHLRTNSTLAASAVQLSRPMPATWVASRCHSYR